MRPLRQRGQLYEELINIPRCVNKNNNQWAAPLSASMGTATLWKLVLYFVRDLDDSLVPWYNCTMVLLCSLVTMINSVSSLMVLECPMAVFSTIDHSLSFHDPSTTLKIL